MRSDWYSVDRFGRGPGDKGRGYGHGVGLCQAGAFEMAMEGRNDTEILSFYFPGTVAGITPAGDGWQKIAGAGWTLLTTDPARRPAGRRQCRLGKGAVAVRQLASGTAPTVQELPTTELFRQTTGEPGWTLASTRGSNVFLQPAAVRQNNGGTGLCCCMSFCMCW